MMHALATWRLWLILIAPAACASPQATATLQGQALMGPTCPVVIEGGSCDDLPAANRTLEFYARGETLVARTATDSEGYFLIELPAGRYRLQLQLRGIETMDPTEVEIVLGRVTRVILHIDTGLR